MEIPEHLWRYPTGDAIDALARRFDLPNFPDMQDWQWIVADSARLDEFIAAYDSGELGEDERFTLMETILQSFEDLGEHPELDPRWPHIVETLDRNIDLHAHTVWYWSCLDSEGPEEEWRISQFIRPILAKHRARLEVPRKVGRPSEAP